MSNKPFFNILLLILSLFLSCEKEVNIKLPDELTKPVVNSVFSPDNLFSVAVFESNTFLPIENASVELFIAGQWVETLEHVDSGIYQSGNYLPEEGEIYSIRVNIPEFREITSQDTVPESIQILKVVHHDSTGINSFNARYATFEITFKDPPEQQNFYEVFITEKIDTSNLILIDSSGQDLIIDGVSLGEVWKQQWANRILTLFSSEPSIKAEGFEDQLSAVGTNQSFLYFSDQSINGEAYILRLNYFPYYHGDGSITFYLVPKRDFTICLRSISRSYYEFRKSQHLYQMYSTQNSLWRNAGDFVHIYSNIENGYGLFAGYAAYIDSITVFNNF